MKPLVSIIMGSTSDLTVVEKAAQILNSFRIPFEINALSAHRTPEEVVKFAKGAAGRGIKVIIAAAGMAAHLPGVIASMTPLPVIGVPVNASLEGLDSILSILQMPPGIPVATVGVNAAQNAAILAAQIIGTGDEKILKEVINYKQNLKKKIVESNKELKEIKFKYKTN
jgi:5-(carboxyamino)imidazole ribonucleotide mutase